MILLNIKHDELIISADKFSGYSTIKEQAIISSMIDANIYAVQQLNGNVIKVKLK